jgi:hypothetical protein
MKNSETRGLLKSNEPVRCDGFDATNPRSSAFICGSFSSDPITIKKNFFRSYHFIFFQNEKKRLCAVSPNLPNSPGAPSGMRLGNTEGGAPDVNGRGVVLTNIE